MRNALLIVSQGCSPDDMREIIASAIDQVETNSALTQDWLDNMQSVASD